MQLRGVWRKLTPKQPWNTTSKIAEGCSSFCITATLCLDYLARNKMTVLFDITAEMGQPIPARWSYFQVMVALIVTTLGSLHRGCHAQVGEKCLQRCMSWCAQ
jgi:hypothetical protein